MAKRMLNEEVVAHDFLGFIIINRELKERNRSWYEKWLNDGKYLLSDKRGRDFADRIEDISSREIKSDYEIVCFAMAVFLSYMFIKG